MYNKNKTTNVETENTNLQFMSFFEDLGGLISDIAGATVDLGCELGGIASDGAQEFVDNPV